MGRRFRRPRASPVLLLPAWRRSFSWRRTPMRDPRELRHQQSRYPGYDVLSKRDGPSWNEQTRRVIARRLSVDPEPRFFTAEEFKTVGAIAGRLVAQRAARPPGPH